MSDNVRSAYVINGPTRVKSYKGPENQKRWPMTEATRRLSRPRWTGGHDTMPSSVRAAATELAHTAHRLGLAATFVPIELPRLILLQRQLDLPDDLLTWYATASPADFAVPTPGNDAPLAPGDRLDDALRGYRYHALTNVPLPGWTPAWIVIGGEPGYPLIVHAAASHDPAVYYGAPSQGTYRLTPLSADLAGFLRGVSAYLDLYLGHFAGAVLTTDESLTADLRSAFTAALDARPSTAGRAPTWLRAWLAIDF